MPNKKNKGNDSASTVGDFPIVGIGASAGGLDAFKLLLKAIPRKSGMAYILVQHLSPSHESILPEILSKISKTPVIEIKDNTPIEPDVIYVVPANKVLTVTDRKLQLTPRDDEQSNHPIDIFFMSLAAVHQSLTIGIVLSGSGSDGSLGLKAIKENGGITLAQDVDSASYQGMPQSAIATGMVDFVLPPGKIPEQLLKIRNSYSTSLSDTEEVMNKEEENTFRQILSILREYSGVDFSYYKQPTIRRRIARRMMIRKVEKLDAYLKYLRTHKEEQNNLYQDVLIPVTSFFRDPEFSQTITGTVLPALFKNKPAGEPFRLWIAGCSTGEEVYSLAICLHEFLGDQFSTHRIQIFGTDISENAISQARTGQYSKGITANVSHQRLREYFIKTEAGYQVNKLVRDVCVFAVHNFLKDPPFSNMDIISCRNVLIYMNSYLQNKSFSVFHYALKEKGLLVLGKSETPGTNSVYFSPIARGEKIYTRKAVRGRFTPIAGDRYTDQAGISEGKIPSLTTSEEDFRRKAENILLSRYTPPAVIINEEMDIVHVHGSLASFLEPSPGKPTFNLLKMAREGLGFELRNALHKAKENNAAVIKEHLPVRDNGKKFTVTIEVIPFTDTVERHYMVLFHKTSIVPEESSATIENSSPHQVKLRDALKQIKQLEKELAQVREDMRTISEEQEAANEELQSANEELLSSSEELQSLNEELETSKEELQSSNEELTVVNQELNDKQDQLNESLHYTESIIATIREPLVILDKAMRVKSANASFYAKFQLTTEQTVGKFFYELQNHQWDVDILRSQLEKVLPARTEMKDLEITVHFPHLGERTMLMNAKQVMSKDAVKLVLLAIEDVTEIRNKERQLQASETKFKQLAETTPLMVWTASPEGKRTYSNAFILQYTGRKFESLLEDGWHTYISPIDLEKMVKQWRYAISGDEDSIIEYRIRRNDGKFQWHRSIAVPQKDQNGKVIGWVGVNIDIEDEISAAQRKDDFINIASHELRTPLTSLKGYVQLMQQEFRSVNDQASLQMTDKVYHHVDKLTSMINVLFNVAKVNEGQLQLRKTEFELDTLITEVGEMMQQNFSKHRVQLELNAHKAITADRDKIEQVLTNLIANAIKFSPQADRVVVTSTTSGATVTFCVRDFGMGINADMQSRIFNRYFRVENKKVQNLPGLGLGLFIVSEIVKLHGGMVSVTSEINQGAVFCVTLPL